jgi:excisionase family DNA binding protein
MRTHEVLTTGEVAKICRVAARTVSKWVDSGALAGYRIPGSKDRRIPLSQLIRFMKQHGIPLNELITGQTRVLILDQDRDIADVIEKVLEEQAQYQVDIANDGFEAGVMAQRLQPHAILVDLHLPWLDAKGLCRLVKHDSQLQLAKVIGMSDRLTEAEAAGLPAQGFDGFVAKPFKVRDIVEAIEQAMRIVY